MLRRSARIAMLIVAVVLVTHAADTIAAVSNSGVLDNVLERYEAQAKGWSKVISEAATWLFWTLALISLTWTFGLMAIRKADLGEFFVEFFRFTVTTGFFWWLLLKGPQFAQSILASMQQLAAQASGLPRELTPSGIVDIGFQIFFRVVDASSVWRFADSLFGLLIGAIILCTLGIVGANMLLLLVSGHVLAFAGVFFLGFGGGRWTSDMAISYYRTVLGIGASLFAMVLCVGIGNAVLSEYFVAMDKSPNFKEMAVMLFVSIILFYTTNKIPPMIASLVGGGGQGAAGIGNFGAGAALGALGMAGAGMAIAGAGLAAGASQIAGGISAFASALSGAKQAVSSGSDLLTKMASGGGETSGSPSPGGSAAPGGSASPFEQAAGLDNGGGATPSATGSAPAGGSEGAQAKSDSADDQAGSTGGEGEEGQAGGDAGGSPEGADGGESGAAEQGGAGGASAAEGGGADFSPAEAEQAGAFNEDAMNEGDALASGADAATAGSASADGGETEGGGEAEGAKAAPQTRSQKARAAVARAVNVAGTRAASAVAPHLGNRGRIAIETGVQLARGMGAAASKGMAAQKAAASKRISATAGGKIADAIRAGNADNTLSGAPTPADRAAEIDAFVDQPKTPE